MSHRTQAIIDGLNWFNVPCVYSQQRGKIRCVHVRTLGDYDNYGKVVRQIVDIEPTTHAMINFLGLNRR